MKLSFTIKSVSVPTESASPLVSLSVKNQCMLIAQTNGELTRYFSDQKESQKIKFVSQSVSGASGLMTLAGSALGAVTAPQSVKVDVSQVFQSDDGLHALIAATTGETYYLSLESNSAVVVSKLKGQVVTCAAFTGDGDAFIGTQTGRICSVSNVKRPEFCVIKLLAEFPHERITDIIADSTVSVFVSTESCAYLVTNSSPQLLWQSPLGCLASRFAIHSDIGGSGRCVSWLNAVSIVTTKLPIANSSSSTVLAHSSSLGISVDLLNAQKPIPRTLPRGFAVSDLHYMILFDNAKIVLISRISLGSAVASVSTPPASSLSVDPGGSIFLWSADRKLSSLILSNEQTDAWKHWLRKRNYAKALAATTSSRERAYVLKHEADFLLETSSEAAQRAASLYAQALKEDSEFIESYFEDISSKLEKVDKQCLLELLTSRLDVSSTTDDSSREVVQVSVLFVYCIHVFAELISSTPERKLSNLLVQFVADRYQSLDKECLKATYAVLESVGLFEELVKIAELVGDTDTAVRIDLQLGKYERIIDRISSVNFADNLSPLLFRFCPREFIGMVLKRHECTDHVLSALAMAGALSREHMEQAVLLLKHWLVSGHQSISSSVFQLLFSLLGALGDESSVSAIIESHYTHVAFDFLFSLRTTKQYKMTNAETVLLSVMGVHVEATLKALACGDVELAKSCAWRSPNENARRTCWRAILAQTNPNEILSLLQDSEVLEVTDVLPLLTSADCAEIKPEIDAEIMVTETKQDELRKQMKHYQEALALIRKDLNSKPNECILLSHSQKCDVCFHLVFSERFVAFNCGHCFHEGCLREALTKRTMSLKSEEEKMQIMSSNCCLCGHKSLLMEQLFEPFVDPAVDAARIEAWTIGY